MGRILGEWRAYRTSREQPQKHTHVFHSWYQLLNADARNMERRHGSPNVSISFISTNHEGARFGDGGVARLKAASTNAVIEFFTCSTAWVRKLAVFSVRKA
jgi:hypothetical protein